MHLISKQLAGTCKQLANSLYKIDKKHLIISKQSINALGFIWNVFQTYCNNSLFNTFRPKYL